MKKIILLSLFLSSVASFSQHSFLHRSGQYIVDGKGQNIILRGMGLGGWMVQEGYMLKTDAFAGTQHKIKEKITDLIGAEDTEKFYKAYRTNGITKKDIDSLAAWGFNSVRLPMHYNLYTLPTEKEMTSGENTWLEEGFKMTDNLLQWCAENKMYLILDLHAAPGGQGKDANISDYDTTKPSLWESESNRNKMIALWTKLADRYKDNPWIGGYDLVNEPNWNFSGTHKNGCDEKTNIPLRALQLSITQAIRKVDTNHIIIIEGNCWGNNYNGIFPLWDENMVLSFHKYWNHNDINSLQNILEYRTKYNVPIWLGESGENSNVWFKEAISLVESNNIGWAFWPMKKIENIAGVTSVTKSPGYDKLLEYWKKGGEKPSQDFAKKTLMQLAENYKIENVTIKADVIDAMFRQIHTNDTKPYKKHRLPGKIAATEYDLGTNGHAYLDKDIANYRTDTGKFEDWNKGYSMRNDGVDISPCNDSESNGYQVSFIEDGEWLQFTTQVKKDGKYNVAIRYSNENKEAGKLHLEINNKTKSQSINLPSTGANKNWKTVILSNLELNSGENRIKVLFEKGGYNLNFLEIK